MESASAVLETGDVEDEDVADDRAVAPKAAALHVLEDFDVADDEDVAPEVAALYVPEPVLRAFLAIGATALAAL